MHFYSSPQNQDCMVWFKNVNETIRLVDSAILNTHTDTACYCDHAQWGWVLKKNNYKHALHDTNFWYITEKRVVTRYLSFFFRVLTIISRCRLFDSSDWHQVLVNAHLSFCIWCADARWDIINIISLFEDVGEEKTRFPLRSSALLIRPALRLSQGR